MKEFVISMLIGYFFGAINPAAAVSALKKKDLTQFGTKNLGATNTMLAFGKKYGVFVMIFDIAKGYIAIKIASLLFPKYVMAGLVAGCSAVIGHIFPVFLKFRGGKGLATYGGLVLAYDPVMFLGLLLIGVVLVLITDYPVALPISVVILGPVWAGVRAQSVGVFLIFAIVGGLMIYKHRENIRKIQNGTETSLRDFVKSRRSKEQLDA